MKFLLKRIHKHYFFLLFFFTFWEMFRVLLGWGWYLGVQQHRVGGDSNIGRSWGGASGWVTRRVTLAHRWRVSPARVDNETKRSSGSSEMDNVFALTWFHIRTPWLSFPLNIESRFSPQPPSCFSCLARKQEERIAYRFLIFPVL